MNMNHDCELQGLLSEAEKNKLENVAIEKIAT